MNTLIGNVNPYSILMLFSLIFTQTFFVQIDHNEICYFSRRTSYQVY